MSKKFDIAVLGGGSAGFAAAVKAASEGASVVMINDRLPLGGTCVNVGCVPSKFLIRAAEALHKVKYYGGIHIEFKVDSRELMRQMRSIVEKLRRAKYEDLLGSYGIELIKGRGVLVGGRVKVNGEFIDAEKIIIATGARPAIPRIEGLDKVPYLTTESFFSIEELPRSIGIIGGGAVALELGQALNRLGVEVHIFERSSRLLKYEEELASKFIAELLTKEGVKLHLNSRIGRVEKSSGGIMIRSSDGEFTVGSILVATGRVPNTEGLEGVKLNKDGGVEVNERMETNIPNVYAAGDVTGGIGLYGGRYAENAAARQGVIAATNALGDDAKYNPLIVPRVVFTDPPIASVGLREDDMISRGIGCICNMVTVDNVAASWTSGGLEGFIKINTYPDTWRVRVNRGRIAGALVASPKGEELIHVLALAVAKGLTVDDLIEMIPAFPSYGEALRLAALSFTTDVTKLSCCGG